MFNNIENVKLLFATYAQRKKVCVTNRKSHILILRVGGVGIHKFKEKTLNAPVGSMIFIPKGSSYTFEPLGEEPCTSVVVSFFADINDPQAMVFDGANFPGLQNVFMNIYKNLKLHTSYSNLMCLSWFYSILAYLAAQEDTTYSDKRKYNLIKPAIDYIEENFFDTTLKTDTLHTLCNVSSAYFRKVFKSNTGLSPQKYIEEKRLEYALYVIKEHEYPISKVAEMCGYNDPLYFGTVFKKKYGISPSYIK